MNTVIAENRKAGHLYNLEKFFNAGLVLQGWEVKSLRAGRAQLADSYVVAKHGELFLINANFSPLPTVSTHIKPEPNRSRKLLLTGREIDQLIVATERKGYALVPIKLYWHHGYAKIEIALAKGKKLYDKRQAVKEREWAIDKLRLQKMQLRKGRG